MQINIQSPQGPVHVPSVRIIRWQLLAALHACVWVGMFQQLTERVRYARLERMPLLDRRHVMPVLYILTRGTMDPNIVPRVSQIRMLHSMGVCHVRA